MLKKIIIIPSSHCGKQPLQAKELRQASQNSCSRSSQAGWRGVGWWEETIPTGDSQDLVTYNKPTSSCSFYRSRW